VGAAASAWKETDLSNKALPMLQSTGGFMARYALLFGKFALCFLNFKFKFEFNLNLIQFLLLLNILNFLIEFNFLNLIFEFNLKI